MNTVGGKKTLGAVRQCKRALSGTACLPFQIHLASLTSYSSDYCGNQFQSRLHQVACNCHLHLFQTMLLASRLPAPEHP